MIHYFLLQGMAVVAARATRLPIYSSFAKEGNLSDLFAKGEAISTLFNVMGIGAGIGLASTVCSTTQGKVHIYRTTFHRLFYRYCCSIRPLNSIIRQIYIVKMCTWHALQLQPYDSVIWTFCLCYPELCLSLSSALQTSNFQNQLYSKQVIRSSKVVHHLCYRHAMQLTQSINELWHAELYSTYLLLTCM